MAPPKRRLPRLDQTLIESRSAIDYSPFRMSPSSPTPDSQPPATSHDNDVLVKVEGVSKIFCRDLKESSPVPFVPPRFNRLPLSIKNQKSLCAFLRPLRALAFQSGDRGQSGWRVFAPGRSRGVPPRVKAFRNQTADGRERPRMKSDFFCLILSKIAPSLAVFAGRDALVP